MGHKRNTNQTNNRRAKNKKAFEQVIDYYNYYETVKSLSPIRATDTAKDNGFGGTLNPATPSILDFTCDVETIIKAVVPETSLQNFIETYIMGVNELSTKERKRYEQRIGQLFISRRIWPIDKYFFTPRI